MFISPGKAVEKYKERELGWEGQILGLILLLGVEHLGTKDRTSHRKNEGAVARGPWMLSKAPSHSDI